MGKILNSSEMEQIFGKANKDGSYLVTIDLPYTMFFDIFTNLAPSPNIIPTT